MSERYEEVRRKLVERGYLHGRIERFLLRDLIAPGGPARAVLRTSLKAAVLGAPLLGGLLAASAVAASAPLFGVRDALVLWLYFGALAALVLFLLDAAAAAIAASWAKHRGARAQALHAGLVVAAPLLLYLVVLQARGRPAGSPWGTIAFLAAALVATAVVAWLAGIVSLTAIVGRTGEVPDRNRRPAALLFAVLLPIALGFFVVPAAAPDAAAPPSSFKAQRAPRVLVVGIDGLDGSLVEALTPRGATEHLLALTASGAMFPKHRAAGPEPAEVWTTLVTGLPADRHGVRGARAARLPGVATPLALRSVPPGLDALHWLIPVRTVPASGACRRVRALWEIASFEAPSAAVNFWATWPARGVAGDASTGYVVSNRTLPKLLGAGAEDRDIRPESLFARLSGEFPSARAAWKAEFDRRFGSARADAAAIAWESCLIDAFAWSTADELSRDPALGSIFVYLPGLDILRQRLLEQPRAGPEDLVAAQVLESYVRWLDETVLAAVDAHRKDASIVLIADPGRSATDQTEGFVAVSGGGASPACVGPPVGDLDVAPLVLRVMGLPASAEMTGRAPEHCFETAAPMPPAIATWGRRGLPSGSTASDYDEEMVERLKSLGYLR